MASKRDILFQTNKKNREKQNNEVEVEQPTLVDSIAQNMIAEAEEEAKIKPELKPEPELEQKIEEDKFSGMARETARQLKEDVKMAGESVIIHDPAAEQPEPDMILEKLLLQNNQRRTIRKSFVMSPNAADNLKKIVKQYHFRSDNDCLNFIFENFDKIVKL